MKPLRIIFFALVLSGCGESFLDVKPNQSQFTPSKISDYQAMMDHTNLLNTSSSHALGIISSDESNMPDIRYDAFASGISSNFMKRAYTWDQIIFEGGEINTDWSRGYSRILQCNIVLDGLKKLVPGKDEQAAFDNVKGSALFYRSMSYYSLAQLFCKPYYPATAGSDLGLPLRLEADVTIKTNRATVADTYSRIVSDLNECLPLLPEVPKTFYSPSKAAAFALLSKIYLQMDNYSAALEHAHNCLQSKGQLLDLNSLNLSARYVFPANGAGNPEIIFMTALNNVTPVSNTNMNMDQRLLDSYAANDLRRKAYFHNNTDGRILFKGSYLGGSTTFTGLAVDEVLLNRAECQARTGNTQAAINDLNLLLSHRHDKHNFQPLNGLTQDQALRTIIEERKKELVFRGVRWEDLRRLNRESRFAQTLIRKVREKEYVLEPNSDRYTFPLPEEAIAAGGYFQNPR